MGLFDFFRKITKKKIEESEEKEEKIAFSDIENWIERKRNETEVKEKEIFILVKEKINVFADELKEKIKVVEDIDVESKKVEDKIKFAVNEGRKKYIESLRDFIEKLEKLERENLGKFIDDVNKISFDFDKSSYMSYERTTILIGKEMTNIKESLKVFYRNLIKVFDENKDIVNSSKTTSLIKLKLNQINENDRILGKINETINDLDKKITEKKEEDKKTLEEIEKIKKSDEYMKNLERQENIKLFNEGLEKDLLGLKQLINFKALANFFHIFEEQMNIVKAHREDFQTSFKKDYGESILDLLNESQLNNENITGKVNQIKNKKEEIEKHEKEIKIDETLELSSKITKIIMEINDLKNEKVREEKRIANHNINKKESIEIIRENMENMGVVLEIEYLNN